MAFGSFIVILGILVLGSHVRVGVRRRLIGQGTAVINQILYPWLWSRARLIRFRPSTADFATGGRVAFYTGFDIEHFQVDQPLTSIFGGAAALVPYELQPVKSITSSGSNRCNFRLGLNGHRAQADVGLIGLTRTLRSSVSARVPPVYVNRCDAAR